MPRHSAAGVRQLKRRDGYVSLEVRLPCRDTQGSLEEARRLWKTVGRENVMIKIPAPRSLPAIQQALSEGININVTCCSHKSLREGGGSLYRGPGAICQERRRRRRMATWPASSSAALTLRSTPSSTQTQASKDAREQEQLKSVQGKVP